MSDRYQRAFLRLKRDREGSFVPFFVLGDPDYESSLQILRAAVWSGADALELGIPYSDPVADGPIIQRSAFRALKSGMDPPRAFSLLAALRSEFDQLPLGLLVYANLVEIPGRSLFFERARRAGVDSVLIADVPTVEIAPYLELARRAGIALVLMATPNASQQQLQQISSWSRGYVYLVSRAGITGIHDKPRREIETTMGVLRSFGACPPILVGFGISRPEHVSSAISIGADGAISGSAVIEVLEENLHDRQRMISEIGKFISTLKAATILENREDRNQVEAI